MLPWIKEYTEQLHDDDYRGLTLAERGLLGGLRQLFAASDGRLTANTRDLTRALNAHVYGRQLQRLSDAGFIEIVASKPARMSASTPAGTYASLEEKRENEVRNVVLSSPLTEPSPTGDDDSALGATSSPNGVDEGLWQGARAFVRNEAWRLSWGTVQSRLSDDFGIDADTAEHLHELYELTAKEPA